MRLLDPVIPLLVLTAMAAGYILYRTTVADQFAEHNAVVQNSVEQNFAAVDTLPYQPSAAASSADASVPLSELNVTGRTENVVETDPSAEAVTIELSKDSQSADTVSVVLRITGLKPQPADVLIVVFDSAQAFPKPELRKHLEVVAATETAIDHTVMLEQHKPLAIAVVQDLDGNRKLTKNVFGIPSEPYGFSNNARGLTGPPEFRDAMFTVDQNAAPLEIHVR